MTKKTSEPKCSNYCALYYWMLSQGIDNILELYIYSGIYGVSNINGAFRGTYDRFSSFFNLQNYSESEIEEAINHLTDKGLMTVSKWIYPDTFEFKAIRRNFN